MEFVTYLFDIIVFSLVAYAFCRERMGLHHLLIQAPWNYFNSDFRKRFDTECEAMAKRITRRNSVTGYSGTMSYTIFIKLFIVLLTSYMSVQFCHWPVSLAFILYHLYRLPLNMASTLSIKRYLEDSEAIGDIA